MKLGINAGDGFTFDGNDLTVNCGDNVSIVKTGTDGQIGLYVENLQGPDGASGGSTYDGWTVIPGSGWPTAGGSKIDNFIDGNRDVVNLIFSFGIKPVSNHAGNGVVWKEDGIKTVDDICNEINFPISADRVGYYDASRNWTSFRPNAGELIQLVTNPSTRQVYSGGSGNKVWIEAGARLANTNQKTMVLFVIREITYKDKGPGVESYWVESMKLSCIYADSSVTAFEVGEDYSGSTTYPN